MIVNALYTTVHTQPKHCVALCTQVTSVLNAKCLIVCFTRVDQVPIFWVYFGGQQTVTIVVFPTNMGDCGSPRKQEVVDRLRERLVKYRAQNNLSYQRFTAALPHQLQSDSTETRALFQRFQESKNKRPAKNVKQEDKQNKVRTDPNGERGNLSHETDASRQHLMVSWKWPSPICVHWLFACETMHTVHTAVCVCIQAREAMALVVWDDLHTVGFTRTWGHERKQQSQL